MLIKDVNFGLVWCASGARNFHMQGWPHHKPLEHLGLLDFNYSAFVAKTTTYDPRPGNMPLTENLQPKELLPECIVVKYTAGAVLNSVGLSGPGAEELMELGIWQKLSKPFQLSFMAVGGSKEEKLEETRKFADLLKKHLPTFTTRFGLQFNVSCPNVGKKELERGDFIDEVNQMLEILGKLGIPIIVKFSPTTDVETARAIAHNHYCNAICLGNSVKWGELANEIDWYGIFGTDVSPLAHLGGGGLTGRPLHPIVKRWVARARKLDFPKPINACGGILTPRDAIEMFEVGADSISLGSVAILRPWNVKRIIRTVHAYHGITLP